MLPKQRITLKEKLAEDEITGKTWAHKTMDYYKEQFHRDGAFVEMTKIYEALEGIIDERDYAHLINPLNISNKSNLNYTATLKNYNILLGIARLLAGEFGRRTHEYTVTDFNPNDESIYKERLLEQTKAYYAQTAVNQLNEAGFPTGKASKELPDYETFVANFKNTFDQNRVISGQEAIDYIRYEQDVDDKIIEMYWDWITVGRCFSFKDVNFDDVDYEWVPARELHVPLEKHSKYVEDTSYQVRRRIISVNALIDLLRGEISEEEIDKLSDDVSNNISSMISASTQTAVGGFIQLPTLGINGQSGEGSYFTDAEMTGGVELFHIVWQCQKRVGTLYYRDELGIERIMDVDENYTLNTEAGDIRIEWEWINDTWQGYTAKDFYWKVGAVEWNRSEVNNDSVQKSLYNGIINRTNTGQIISLIKQGLPYQALVNGLHYQVEKIINKNKDKLTVMPYGLVPRKKGITTKQQMYYADATSILWVDETAPNAQYAAQMIKVLDMSLGTYIKDTIEIIKYIKQEYWDEIGMNQQRYSDIAQGAGKGVTEQAIIRSSIITYDLNRQMDKLIEKDYQGLLDLSKFAWINGKKRKYVRSDGSEAFISLSPDDARQHLETDYGIFVKNSQDMSEAIQQYRGLALTFAQNGGGMGGMAELFTNNNMERLKNIVQRIEDNNKKHEEIVADNEHKRRMAELEKAENTAKLDRENKVEVAEIQKEAQIESARVRSNAGSRANQPKPENPTERMLADHKVLKENKELALKEKDINIKQKQKQSKND
jgi:hypothetical protein